MNKVTYENCLGVLTAFGEDGDYFRFKDSVQTQDTITYYDIDGNIVGNIHLPPATHHITRCRLAKENGIENWHHYSMRDLLFGMAKDDDMHYFDIDPETGKINESTIVNIFTHKPDGDESPFKQFYVRIEP
jgi:hypothetical protein